MKAPTHYNQKLTRNSVNSQQQITNKPTKKSKKKVKTNEKIFTPSYMSPCYVMNGDEKISYGDAKLFLNEADPEKIIGAL